jgi:phosphatidylinositol-3-phosphatase
MPAHAIKTIFVIVMENHDWSAIEGNPDAPYINDVLLPMSSYTDNYYATPTNIHPSEPNYIWMEAGDNLGIWDNDDPDAHMLDADHLTGQLDRAGVSWHSYQEGMREGTCPIHSNGLYAPKHNPFLYFTDVSGDPPSPDNAYCKAHVTPYPTLWTDLASDTVARYNFITPDQCSDMHNRSGCETGSPVKNGDLWLSREVPKILASSAYKDGGALFITWDESEGGMDPIGMIALSPLAKGGGYVSTTRLYHSSLLRTVEEVFGVPLLRDANNHPSLADLFTQYP